MKAYLFLLLVFWSNYLLAVKPKIKLLRNPIQERSVIFDKGEYYPDKIILREGDKLKLFFANLSEKKSCLYGKSLDLFLSADPGEFVEKELVLSNFGEYKLSCPGPKSELTVLVLRRVESRNLASGQPKSGRNPASITKQSSQWVPKDENIELEKKQRTFHKNEESIY